MHNLRNVERRKDVLQEEPGDESTRASAAKPYVAISQDREVASKTWAAVSLPLFSRSLGLAHEFPDQHRHDHPGHPGHEKPPSPAPSRCHLSRQDRRGTKANQ